MPTSDETHLTAIVLSDHEVEGRAQMPILAARRGNVPFVPTSPLTWWCRPDTEDKSARWMNEQ